MAFQHVVDRLLADTKTSSSLSLVSLAQFKRLRDRRSFDLEQRHSRKRFNSCRAASARSYLGR